MKASSLSHSGNDVVYEVETPPTGPAATTTYLALNGQYLAKTVREGLDQPQTFFFHTDLVGSVRAVTDSTGQLVARFEYEPFGLTTLASGALANETHKFTGKPEDGTGLYYFGARYYDPEMGRFTTEDPARQGLNWYAYCMNNPLNIVDKDGMWGKEIHYGSALWGGTIYWAQWNGMFTPEQAAIIAEYDNRIDWGICNPLTGQAHHFDVDPTEVDSRVSLAEQYLKLAVSAGRQARASRSLQDPVAVTFAQQLEEDSLKYLGMGLHVVQDTYAHTNELVEDIVIGSLTFKSHMRNPVPDDPHLNSRGYYKAMEASIAYMQRYWEMILK